MHEKPNNQSNAGKLHKSSHLANELFLRKKNMPQIKMVRRET